MLFIRSYPMLLAMVITHMAHKILMVEDILSFFDFQVLIFKICVWWRFGRYWPPY